VGEDTTPPRRSGTLLLGGMRATQSSSIRFTEPQGRTEELPVRLHHSTRSSASPPYTPWYSEYGFIITTEEDEKCSLGLRIGLWQMSTSTTKLSKCLVFIRKFATCWDI
jgi:hypothetical protein